MNNRFISFTPKAYVGFRQRTIITPKNDEFPNGEIQQRPMLDE